MLKLSERNGLEITNLDKKKKKKKTENAYY